MRIITAFFPLGHRTSQITFFLYLCYQVELVGNNILVLLRGTDTNQQENCLYFETVFTYKFSIHFKYIFLSKRGDLQLMFSVSVYVSVSCVVG